jgi:hypothetical protein
MIKFKDMPFLKDVHFKEQKKAALMELISIMVILIGLSILLPYISDNVIDKNQYIICIGLLLCGIIYPLGNYISFLNNIVVNSDNPIITKDSIVEGNPNGIFANKRIIKVDVSNIKVNRVEDILEMMHDKKWIESVLN